MRAKWIGALPFMAVFLCQMPLFGQSSSPQGSSKPLDDLAKDLASLKGSDAELEDEISGKLESPVVLIALFLGEMARSDARSGARWRYELARVDKQLGGSSGTAGSTSLMSSGSVPALLGLAVENGALTRSESGTSITFRANPVSIARLLQKASRQPSFRRMPGLNLDDFTIGFTFDVDRGEQPGTFTGSSQEFSQFFARLDLINDRDPRSKRWDREWEDFGQKSEREMTDDGISRFSDTATRLLDELEKSQEFAKCHQEAIQRVLQRRREASIRQTLDGFIGCIRQDVPEFEAAVDEALEAWNGYLTERERIRGGILRSSTLAFEYVLDRAPRSEAMMVLSGEMASQLPRGATPAVMEPPDLSTFRLIWSKGFPWRNSELTVNASLSIFNDTPSGIGRLRDYQLGAQFDIPLPELPQIGSSTFSLSGLFASLEEMPFGVPLTINGQPVGLEGKMGLVQAKWSLPLGESGVRIPFSLTWSNRTELIDEDELRGSIGITFDLDKLFLKPQ